MTDSNDIEWSVAIFSNREPLETLKKSIMAAKTACGDKTAVIDVLVNGNEMLARQAAEFVRGFEGGDSDVGIRVWFISLGDKSYAWNTHIHEIEPGADIAFYIDGYVWVRPDAFALLAEGLNNDETRLAATGVPTQGRSAEKLRADMLKHGGIHGNLVAFRGSVMRRLRAMEFKLPIGMYRGVLLFGSILYRNLNPGADKRDTSRILVHPDATWQKPETSVFDPGVIEGQVKRKFRQARGFMENPAARQHIVVNQWPPRELPEYADDLIIWWAKSSKTEVIKLCLRHWLCAFELYKAYRARNKKAEQPRLKLFSEVGQPNETQDKSAVS
jgi:hypothetical protein